MKRSVVMLMSVCAVFAFSSCKSSESAYKKAYEKAKQQELAEAQQEPVESVAPVVTSQPEVKVVESVSAPVRQEKVTVVSGAEDGLKDYSVICGSFGIKANAEGVKARLESAGYHALVVFNADAATYRVAVSSFDDKASAVAARDAFKAKYPNDADFQKAWILYRIK